jgi:hypothetical protein
VIIVHLAEGWTGAQLLDVIRGLYIYYPTPSDNGEAAPAGASESESESESGAEAEAQVETQVEADATVAPESVTDRETAVEASEATTEPVDTRVADEDPQK